jgi:uncharacterized cupin superfamily protein
MEVAPVTRPFVNVGDLTLRATGNGGKFAGQAARFGGQIGAKKLGCQYQVLPPGKAAYPRHAHHVNEEMFVILSGEGTYRVGDQSYPVREGDIIAAPPGDGSTAHQIFNSSGGELRYLSISTRLDPDIIEYPDSDKFTVSSMVPEQQGLMSAKFSFIGRKNMSVDYYDGEDDTAPARGASS